MSGVMPRQNRRSRFNLRGWSCSLLGVAIALSAVHGAAVAAEPQARKPATVAANDPSVQRALAMLSRVGGEGADNAQAAAAWRQLVGSPAEHTTRVTLLPQLLAALDDASPLGANWIRAAFETIADRALRDGGKLPTDQIEQFFADRHHAPRARRLAYEWLSRADPTAAVRLTPGLIDDPSVELRRDAVAQSLDAAAALAKQSDSAAAVAAYRKALDAARDEDQVKTASEALKELGQPVRLAEHYGFLLHWRIVGPFDNAGKRGFNKAYPPEEKLDLSAEYAGKFGPARWTEITSKDDLGQVDLNEAIGKEKGVLAYAFTELESPQPQVLELRLGTESATKVWLNGRLVFEREVYHALTQMDQYVMPLSLQAGRNTLLLKVCQNEQTDTWAGDWKFQARICDATGGAVHLVESPSAAKPASNATSLQGN
jgi:hypothetical protein